MRFQPRYLQLLEDGGFLERIEKARRHFSNCHLCPRACGVDRNEKKGYCQAGTATVVSSFGPHFGEESVLVGPRGSGTVFFAHCNLRCVFCQNHEISFGGLGHVLSNEQLADILLTIQNRYGCANINLVTPTHFLPNILEAVYLAAQQGLHLPLVYNCGGYESLAALKLLDGVIDIYMPDFKYAAEKRSETYSQAEDYPTKAKKALVEMDRQVGGVKLCERGLAQEGLLIRHLMLPGGLCDTKNILRFIKENLSSDCLVNLMGQYYPSHQSFLYPEINKRLTRNELSTAYKFARSLGLNLV